MLGAVTDATAVDSAAVVTPVVMLGMGSVELGAEVGRPHFLP